jgi:hypothetical protein
MISLIICSRDEARFSAVHAMYQSVLSGADWEMIRIADARSLAEGYNRGICKSRGENLIFSHDDIEVLSPDFAGCLARHLSRFDLIGVAGTDLLVGPHWADAGPPHLFGQVVYPLPDGRFNVNVMGVPSRAVGGIQGLDGCFMAARRAVVERIAFDAVNFDGFHLYDLDFSFQAYHAGFKVAVVNDIHILHQSGGDFGAEWDKYAERFAKTWRMPPLVRPRRVDWASAPVMSKAEAVKVMTPVYWDQET